MHRHRKIAFWTIGVAGAFAILLLVFFLLLPTLVNLEPLKEKIVGTISRRLEADVHVERIDVSFFPRPRVALHQVRLSLPEKVTANVDTFTVFPKILPLFIGRVDIGKLGVVAPEVEVTLRGPPHQEAQKRNAVSLTVLRKQVAFLLAPLGLKAKASGLVVAVENGSLDFSQEQKPLLGLRSIDAHIHLLEDRLEIEASSESNLNRMHLDHPPLEVGARFLMKPGIPGVSLEVECREVDIQPLREAALAMAGDSTLIQDIFDVLKSGNVPHATLNAEGKTLADLGKTENFVIKGTMRDGRVFVREAHLDLEEVNGDVVISQGILEGNNLQARWGNSVGHNGVLKLGLEGEDTPFHLEAEVEADLIQLQPYLKQWVEDESFLREIDLIDKLTGRAKGRLVLGESTASINARVDVSTLQLTACYERSPYPIVIQSGEFYYDDNGVRVHKLLGKVASSAFSGVSARLDWHRDTSPYFEVRAGKSTIALGEIYSWLTSFEQLKPRLKNVEKLQGAVSLASMNLRGPLLQPEEWHLEATGRVHDLSLSTDLFEKPIRVSKGRFDLAETADHKTLFLKDAQIAVLDALLHVSGKLDNYLSEPSETDITLQGSMGTESIRWVSNLISLSPLLKPRSSLAISSARMVWKKDVSISFAGALVVHKGPKIALDVQWSPVQLILRNLSILDETSNASLRLNLVAKRLGIGFSGHLAKETVDRIFLKELFPTGWIKGEFRANILIDQPGASTAQGELEGGNLLFPWDLGRPLAIDRISLSAKGNKLQVNTARLTWGDDRLDLHGDVTSSTEEYYFDMAVSADCVDWDNLGGLLGGENGEEQVSSTESLWHLPLKGKVQLRSDEFRYSDLAWRPFVATISFSQGRLAIVVTDATLCGISTPGVITLFPEQVRVDVELAAKDQKLGSTFTCFGDKEELVTGTFDVHGRLTGEGANQDLLQSLEGGLGFAAKKGRIHRYGVLAKVIAFVNLTEIFKGKIPDVVEKGFAYNSITAKGDIKQGQLLVKECVLDGASMEIVCEGNLGLFDKKLDLKLLVAPFKTVDSVVKRIPGLGYILGGSLVSIPVKVTGTLTDPRVTYLDVSEVESGLVGIMKKAFKYPVKILYPKEKSH
jgi:hypothetical protein